MKDKLEKLLTQIKDADIIREIGVDDEMGSLFFKPIILVPKNDYVKPEMMLATWTQSLTSQTTGR